MRIATTTVALGGYDECRRKPAQADVIHRANQWRLATLEEGLAKARERGVDLMCLPGGYFLCPAGLPEEAYASYPFCALDTLVGEVIGLAERHNVALAVGLDRNDKKEGGEHFREVASATLGWFALCWSPGEEGHRLWRQRSVTSGDQWWCPDALCREVRSVRVGDGSVEVLMCGELFNRQIREAIATREHKPVAVVDLVHRLQGFRATEALKAVSEGEVHAFCSGHAGKRGAVKWHFAPGSRQESTREVDFECCAGPRLEAEVWSI